LHTTLKDELLNIIGRERFGYFVHSDLHSSFEDEHQEKALSSPALLPRGFGVRLQEDVDCNIFGL
jgi:hypothetical protein